jgi:hypothetical protein
VKDHFLSILRIVNFKKGVSVVDCPLFKRKMEPQFGSVITSVKLEKETCSPNQINLKNGHKRRRGET